MTATRRSSASEEDYERESLTLGSRDNTVRLWGSFVSSFFLSGSLQSGMIENVLAKDIYGLEPRLTRQGYNAKVLVELLNAKPREIKSFLRGQLASGRAQELQSELLAAGIPL